MTSVSLCTNRLAGTTAFLTHEDDDSEVHYIPSDELEGEYWNGDSRCSVTGDGGEFPDHLVFSWTPVKKGILSVTSAADEQTSKRKMFKI